MPGSDILQQNSMATLPSLESLPPLTPCTVVARYEGIATRFVALVRHLDLFRGREFIIHVSRVAPLPSRPLNRARQMFVILDMECPDPVLGADMYWLYRLAPATIQFWAAHGAHPNLDTQEFREYLAESASFVYREQFVDAPVDFDDVLMDRMHSLIRLPDEHVPADPGVAELALERMDLS